MFYIFIIGYILTLGSSMMNVKSAKSGTVPPASVTQAVCTY